MKVPIRVIGRISRKLKSNLAIYADSCTPAHRKLLGPVVLFYILSALLLLAGCFLICIPIPFGYREMWIIVLLLGVINIYEAMVILTSAYIIRRLSGAVRAGAPGSREVSVLLVLATVLFLDGHFTVNACLTTDFAWGLLIAGASLVL